MRRRRPCRRRRHARRAPRPPPPPDVGVGAHLPHASRRHGGEVPHRRGASLPRQRRGALPGVRRNRQLESHLVKVSWGSRRRCRPRWLAAPVGRPRPRHCTCRWRASCRPASFSPAISQATRSTSSGVSFGRFGRGRPCRWVLVLTRCRVHGRTRDAGEPTRLWPSRTVASWRWGARREAAGAAVRARGPWTSAVARACSASATPTCTRCAPPPSCSRCPSPDCRMRSRVSTRSLALGWGS